MTTISDDFDNHDNFWLYMSIYIHIAIYICMSRIQNSNEKIIREIKNIKFENTVGLKGSPLL